MALREHSRAELERKLCSRPRVSPAAAADLAQDVSTFADTAEVDASLLKAEVQRVLDELETRGLLSDQRTADALMQAKASRYGSRRLKQMLQAKSLAAELVDSSLRQARDTEFERAREVWRRRFGRSPVDLRERARQQRFLASRGFEAAVIERVLKEARLQAADRADLDDD